MKIPIYLIILISFVSVSNTIFAGNKNRILLIPIAGKGIKKSEVDSISNDIRNRLVNKGIIFVARPEDLAKKAAQMQKLGMNTDKLVNEIGRSHSTDMIMPCQMDNIGIYKINCVVYHKVRGNQGTVWETWAGSAITIFSNSLSGLSKKIIDKNKGILGRVNAEKKAISSSCRNVNASFFIKRMKYCGTNEKDKAFACFVEKIDVFCSTGNKVQKCIDTCNENSAKLLVYILIAAKIKALQEDIKRCYSGGEGHSYNLDKNTCEYKDPKESCRDKGEMWQWNYATNECKKLSKSELEEKCQTAGFDLFWNGSFCKYKYLDDENNCKKQRGRWNRMYRECIDLKKECLEKGWAFIDDKCISMKKYCDRIGKKYFHAKCITWKKYCKKKKKTYSSKYNSCVPNRHYCEDRGKKYENGKCVPIPIKPDPEPSYSSNTSERNSLAMLASIAVPGLGHMIKAPNPKGFLYSLFWMGWAGSTYNNFRMYSNAYNDAKKQYNSPLWGNHSIARDVILYEFLYQEYKRNGDSAKRSGINFIAIYFMSILTTNWTSSDSRFFASSRQKDNNHRFFTLDIYQKPVSSLSDFWSSKVEQYYNLQFNKNF